MPQLFERSLLQGPAVLVIAIATVLGGGSPALAETVTWGLDTPADYSFDSDRVEILSLIHI